jgi:HD-GYP domain-containing protein (c-di-GMP phosphodiesterase class II)
MFVTATIGDSATSVDSDYVSVRALALQSVDTASVDLFVRYEREAPPVLYCRAGCPIGSDQFQELAEAGVEHLCVRSSDFDLFGSMMRDSLDSYLRRDDVPQTDRFAALQVAVAVEIEQSLRLSDCSKFRSVAEKVGHDLVALLATSDVLPRDLFRIARHDFNTFTHVTNVASYSIILAENLGIHATGELELIAAAAMLHDVGKRFIPASILAKPGRLEPEERELIESHPTRGYEELCDRPGLSFGQLMMVYQHHEHVDGSGYPVQILGEEIHPWAKMLAVVDVFDAMTAKRPYRRSAAFDYVLDYLRQRSGTHFDPEMVTCWTSAMNKV